LIITGSTGFIGRNLVKGCALKGHRISVITRQHANANYIKSRFINASDISVHDYSQGLAGVIRPGDVVVHLAALQAGRGIKDEEYEKINYSLTQDLVKACPSDIGLFIYLSTVRVYGDHGEDRIDEEASYNGHSRYAISKMRCEKYLEACCDSYGLRYCIIQPSYVYGPGDRNGIMAKFLRLAKFRLFPFIEGGRTVLNFIYIDDLVKMLIRIIDQCDRFVGTRFIAGYPEDVSMAQLYELIEACKRHRVVPVRMSKFQLSLLSRSRLISESQIDTLTTNMKLNTNRIYSALKFEPITDISAGITKTLGQEGVR
jgi:nucleoside-diphosphate-sugar epimerase